MSNENKTIHEFDFNLICEYFSNVERQGPGSPEATLKALSFIDNLADNSRIADLGCGTGGQTMILAENAPGQITGLDLFPEFINIFSRNAKQSDLSDRVKGVVGSMDDLPFGKESLDLIWSEGAIANIGFKKGLNYWNGFLKKDGYVALTYESWFTDDRPAENDYSFLHLLLLFTGVRAKSIPQKAPVAVGLRCLSSRPRSPWGVWRPCPDTPIRRCV